MKTIEHIDVGNIQKELNTLSMKDLRARFSHYYSYTPQTRKKSHLVSKILWAIQRDAFGDISAETREKALRIANDRDVRERFPTPQPAPPKADEQAQSVSYTPSMEMLPGTTLKRIHKGREIRATVLENGFEWDGRWFKSLSAIAREATGTQWNGKLFFGVKGKAAK